MSDPNKMKYKVMEPTGMFKNKGYKEWVQDWSNWFYAVNPDQNNNGDVVFLRSIPLSEDGQSKGPNVMVGDDSLVISEDQYILAVIICALSITYDFENPEIMYNVVRSHTKNGDNPPKKSQLKINGKTIEGPNIGTDFSEYEIETPIFQIAIPEDTEGKSMKHYGDNATDLSGFFPCVTRGYFVMLKFEPGDYYIECTASGATTEYGPYTASFFYHIIVNESVQKSSPQGFGEHLSLHDRPNRNLQLIIEKKMGNNELSDKEYLEIVEKLRIPEKDLKFKKKALENIGKLKDT